MVDKKSFSFKFLFAALLLILLFSSTIYASAPYSGTHNLTSSDFLYQTSQTVSNLSQETFAPKYFPISISSSDYTAYGWLSTAKTDILATASSGNSSPHTATRNDVWVQYPSLVPGGSGSSYLYTGARFTSLISNALINQKNVSVDSVSHFLVGESIVVSDQSHSEINTIASISANGSGASSGMLTMSVNLTNTYLVGNLGRVTLNISQDQGVGFENGFENVTTSNAGPIQIADNLGVAVTIGSLVYPTKGDIADALVILNLTEGAGVPVDTSSLPNTIVNSPGVTWSENIPFAGSLAAMEFTRATPDWVEIVPTGVGLNGFVFHSGDSLTLETWVYPVTNGVLNTLISADNGTDFNYRFYIGADDKLKFEYSDVVGVEHTYSSSNIVISSVAVQRKFDHFAVRYTFGIEGSIGLYQNGVKIEGTWNTNGNDAPMDFNAIGLGNCIGVNYCTGVPANGLDGYVGAIRIWRSYRSENQIRNNAHSNLGARSYSELARNALLRGIASQANVQGWAIGLFGNTSGDAANRGIFVWVDRDTADEIESYLSETAMGITLQDGDIVMLRYRTADAATEGKLDVIRAGASIYSTAYDTTGTAIAYTGGVIIGTGYTGTINQVDILSGVSTIGTGTSQLKLDFEPNQISRTQVGTVNNGWKWIYSVADQSVNSLSTSYNLLRDFSDFYIAEPVLQIIDPSEISRQQIPLKDSAGSIGLEASPVSQGPSDSMPFAGPWNASADALQMQRSPFWFLAYGSLMLVIATTIASWTKQSLIAVIFYLSFMFFGLRAHMYDLYVYVDLLVVTLGIFAAIGLRTTGEF